MSEQEKKEVESSEEDEQKESEEKETDESSEEEGTSEEEEKEEEEKEDFEKSKEYVPANKHNQTLRKLRESELEKRELEKKLQDVDKSAPQSAEEKKAPVKKDEDEESFFEDEDEEKEEKEKQVQPDVSSIVEEKMKPVLDSISKREKEDRKKDRTAFFEAHPEYREDSEKWSGLLDTMDKYINPNSDESYYEQLNASHILYTGQNMEDAGVADKKREMAGDASSSGAGAQKAGTKEDFTQEDRKTMKEFGVSEEGMKAFKKKVESGSMQILG